jgi:hypothetical protein
VTVDAGVEFGGRLLAALDGLAGELRHRREREERVRLAFQKVHTVPIAPGLISLTAGAGTLDTGGQGQAGPMGGYCWSVKRLSALGFTAGTVNAYINGSAAALDAQPDIPWASAGMYTFGNGEVILMPQDRLIFTASGITGEVLIKGSAVELPVALLPWFLMGSPDL